MSKKLFLNSLSGTALYLTSIVAAFIISPILIKSLGNRDYGLWELVMSVIGYMGLLDLGVGTALVRFVAVADGKQDRDDLQQTISTAFMFFLIVGLFALLVFSILGYSPHVIAGADTKGIANLGTVFFLLGLNAGLQFPLQVFIATLMGLQRHYFVNNIRLVLAVIRTTITYFLLIRFSGKGLIILALLEPIFTCVQFIMFAGLVSLDKEIPKLSISAVTMKKIKELFSFGGKNATILIASRLQSQSVPIIIGKIIGLGNIVYFVMPNRLIDYAKGVAWAIGFPLSPYFGASVGRGDHEELLRSWLNTTLALQVVSLAMPIIIFFCGESFLAIWIGHEYAAAGRIILYILLAGLVADSLAVNAFRVLTAKGKHGSCAVSWLILSALSIPMGIVAASRWGMIGVTVATTVVTVLGNLITLLLTCSIMKLPFNTYFRSTILRVALPLLLLTIVLWGITTILPANNYLHLFIHLLTAMVVYIPSVWFFTLGSDLRGQIYDRIIVFTRSKVRVL